MKDYSVSGCIVTYNNKDKIAPTIESILAHTQGVPFTLYVVDNASTDGTAQFVKERFPSVVVIESETNRGFGAGHNRLLPMLESKYHAVINPDILFTSDILTELSEYADAHENVGLLSPRICFEDGREQLLAKRNPTVRYLGNHWFCKTDAPNKAVRDYCMTDMPQDKPFPISNATGCFMFFRTSVFREMGGFDERFFMYLEDCDIARRIHESENYETLHYPMASVVHLWERGSKRSKKLLFIHMKSILTYFLKWGLKF